MFDFANSPLLRRRTNGERVFTLLGIFLIFLVLDASAGLLSGFIPGSTGSVILASGGFWEILSAFDPATGDPAMLNEDTVALFEEVAEGKGFYVLNLFSTVWTVAATVFVILVIERRSLSTVGIEARRAGLRYAGGALIGCFLFTTAILLSILTRAARFDGLVSSPDILFLVLCALGFMIQGAAEEILIRGFLLTSLARRMSWLPSVLLSSLFFVLLHFGNHGINAIGTANLFLFSFFISLFVLRTGNLIGAAALHGVWNFLEGPIFGCGVSGSGLPASLFSVTFDPTRTGTNGGEFGPEGGLAVTLVLVVALAAVLLFPAKKKDAAASE